MDKLDKPNYSDYQEHKNELSELKNDSRAARQADGMPSIQLVEKLIVEGERQNEFNHSISRMEETKTIKLEDFRQRVQQILDDSGKRELIKQCIENGDVVLKPDLEISCNVGAQTDALSFLQAFQPQYLCLVLEVVLEIPIEYTNELNFMEQLEKLAHKYIFHSPAIARNKRYIYTRGNWLTEEGKKAVERHFLQTVCQIFYLMEQCVVHQIIPDNEYMFKPDTPFLSMNDVFSFMSRELIGGKTLLPKVMESIGFKPTHVDPPRDPNRSSFVRPCHCSADYSAHFRFIETTNEHIKAPNSARKQSVQRSFNKNRIQQRLAQEAQDTRIGELFNQMDQTEMNSVLNQTQATVENIEKHMRGLTSYHASIQALYNQLKHTAQFLAEIVHSLGLDDEQIKLIIQKINQLQLSIQETGEISTKLANDTQQIVAELSAVSFRIEQTIRTTFIEPSSFVESSRNNNNNKVVDEIAAKNQLLADNNKKFAEKENELLSQIKELQRQVESTRLEKENLEFQVDAMTKSKNETTQQLNILMIEKKEIEEKYSNVVKLLEARNTELESRENIIEELRVEAGKQKLPAGLEEEISSQLQTIYNTMTDVTNRMNKN